MRAIFGIKSRIYTRLYLTQQSFITCHLDRCNSLLYGLPDTLIAKLQRIQNSAARLVTRTRGHDHITPVLYNLHWLPVKYRIIYKILLLTYKCLHGLAPDYLADLIQEYKPSRNLRSSSKLNLVSLSVLPVVTSPEFNSFYPVKMIKIFKVLNLFLKH